MCTLECDEDAHDDHDELAARVRVLFRLRGLLTDLALANSEVHVHNNQLEKLVRARTAAFSNRTS